MQQLLTPTARRVHRWLQQHPESTYDDVHREVAGGREIITMALAQLHRAGLLDRTGRLRNGRVGRPRTLLRAVGTLP